MVNESLVGPRVEMTRLSIFRSEAITSVQMHAGMVHSIVGHMTRAYNLFGRGLVMVLIFDRPQPYLDFVGLSIKHMESRGVYDVYTLCNLRGNRMVGF